MLLRRMLFLLLLPLLLVSGLARAQSEPTPRVVSLTADGPLTPAMAEYLRRGIRLAEQDGAEALIFQLNTPGGSVDLMNEMVQSLRASPVPVVVYVAPRGAMAGSAGVLLTLAGHVAAMAPETTIGAASPVGSEGEDLGETMAAKEKNILKATARSLSERRGEQAVQLAEEMIETAAAATAAEALGVGLVDFIAADLTDLLQQMDGQAVELAGETITLHTANAQVTPVSLTFIEQLLAILTNPNIVFLLLTIGVQAILIEISSPGGWVAGFIGAVCLALAAYGLGVLPVNWFGIVFLLIAFTLFVLDIKAPTHGALTVAGVASLIIGALVLFNSPSVPEFQRVSVPLILVVSSLTGAVFFAVLLVALRARRAPIAMGVESMLGKTGFARTALNPQGQVRLGGELWTAELEAGQPFLLQGAQVRVLRVEGLKLIVRAIDRLDS